MRLKEILNKNSKDKMPNLWPKIESAISEDRIMVNEVSNTKIRRIPAYRYGLAVACILLVTSAVILPKLTNTNHAAIKAPVIPPLFSSTTIDSSGESSGDSSDGTSKHGWISVPSLIKYKNGIYLTGGKGPGKGEFNVGKHISGNAYEMEGTDPSKTILYRYAGRYLIEDYLIGDTVEFNGTTYTIDIEKIVPHQLIIDDNLYKINKKIGKLNGCDVYSVEGYNDSQLVTINLYGEWYALAENLN